MRLFLRIFAMSLGALGIGNANASQQPCGNGEVMGIGVCDIPSFCCSEFGYCDDIAEHCDPSTCWSGPSCSRRGAHCGGGIVGTGVCEDSSLCCSELGYCDSNEAHCDPSTCWSGPECPREGTPCGSGIPGTGLCEDTSLCCGLYGRCDSTPEHCDAASCSSNSVDSCTRDAAVLVNGLFTSAPTSEPTADQKVSSSNRRLTFAWPSILVTLISIYNGVQYEWFAFC
jgi:hypothetical protein